MKLETFEEITRAFLTAEKAGENVQGFKRYFRDKKKNGTNHQKLLAGTFLKRIKVFKMQTLHGDKPGANMIFFQDL